MKEVVGPFLRAPQADGVRAGDAHSAAGRHQPAVGGPGGGGLGAGHLRPGRGPLRPAGVRSADPRMCVGGPSAGVQNVPRSDCVVCMHSRGKLGFPQISATMHLYFPAVFPFCCLPSAMESRWASAFLRTRDFEVTRWISCHIGVHLFGENVPTHGFCIYRNLLTLGFWFFFFPVLSFFFVCCYVYFPDDLPIFHIFALIFP